jgi:hypothetical protein
MQFRVNIRRLKQLIWVLCALTFAFAGYKFYEIYTAKSAGKYNAQGLEHFEKLFKLRVSESRLVAKGKPDFYTKDRFEKLWEALVDGSVRVVDKPDDQAKAAPVEPEFVVPKLDTIVDLGLVVDSSNPVERFIAITYLDGGKAGAPGAGAAAPGGAGMEGKVNRLHLSEGDPLKPPYDAAPYNGKVLRIGLQEVAFQWGKVGEEVTLTPGLGTDGGGVTQALFKIDPKEDPTADIVAAPPESQQVEPDHWVLGSNDLTKMKDDPQAFLSQQLNVRTVTAPDGGRTQLEITEVKEDSLAAKFGAQPGDKIISVNGFPMSSLSAAINWAKANPDLPSYVVVYESKGQLKTLTFHVK